jgi:hypothetical protein
MIFDASNYLPDLAARIKAEHKAVGDALNSAVMHAYGGRRLAGRRQPRQLQVTLQIGDIGEISDFAS